MAKKKATRPRPSSSRPSNSSNLRPPDAVMGDNPELTGKFLVLFQDGGSDDGLKQLKDSFGLAEVCFSHDFDEEAMDMDQASQAEVVMFDNIGVAVVNADPSQQQSISQAAVGNSAILSVEPEHYMYALGSITLDYLKGYRDAVASLIQTMESGEKTEESPDSQLLAALANTSRFTWGIQATRVDRSRFVGRGIRVAILDTGFDINGHPDFVGRNVRSMSFIPGEAVQDNNGHGTHCTGTALGPASPASRVRRYGCASQGEIFIGKVLSNAGSGSDSGILAGINWAIGNQCRVISMSLGSRVAPGTPHSPVYESIAKRALSSSPGTLIVAAAGNDSRNPATGARLNPPAPVGRPANCPSIMAVASLDSQLNVSPFSNGGVNSGGGEINIAAPGSAVFSSVPDPFPASVQPINPVTRPLPWPPRHHTISGTSMATPHVAGIAAMWLEANPTANAQQLWNLLVNNAKRLPLPSRDVGAGLVQAP